MTFLRSWIGVDLDGTLAEYGGSYRPGEIGAPIPRMVDRVKQWLEEGKYVKIFTARMYSDGSPAANERQLIAAMAMRKWCTEVFGQPLDMTCVKDFAMIELWDDRAVQVEMNTGKRADGKS